MTAQDELILEIGAEGGSLKVVGRRNADGTWLYRTSLRDQTVVLFENIDAGETRKESGWVDTWDELILALDKYPWAMLFVLRVHPESSDQILAEAEPRLVNAPGHIAEMRLARWKERCRPADGTQ